MRSLFLIVFTLFVSSACDQEKRKADSDLKYEVGHSFAKMMNRSYGPNSTGECDNFRLQFDDAGIVVKKGDIVTHDYDFRTFQLYQNEDWQGITLVGQSYLEDIDDGPSWWIMAMQAHNDGAPNKDLPVLGEAISWRIFSNDELVRDTDKLMSIVETNEPDLISVLY
ncbi:MAG: hypothetical protein AAGJ51_01260, partial [Pseudomonadota bacterium]